MQGPLCGPKGHYLLRAKTAAPFISDKCLYQDASNAGPRQNRRELTFPNSGRYLIQETGNSGPTIRPGTLGLGLERGPGLAKWCPEYLLMKSVKVVCAFSEISFPNSPE